MKTRFDPRRLAAWALMTWALGLCGYLGVFSFFVTAEFADWSAFDGYEAVVAFLVYSWFLLGGLQVAAFWALRRASAAPDPFLVAVLSVLPMLNLVIAPVLVRQAAVDLEERGHPIKVATIAVWAWVAPVVIYGGAWAIIVIGRISDVVALNDVVLSLAMLGGLSLPSLLRLRIAFLLRRALLDWERDSTTTAPRASYAAPIAG